MESKYAKRVRMVDSDIDKTILTKAMNIHAGRNVCGLLFPPTSWSVQEVK